jgi:hypothetical protein
MVEIRFFHEGPAPAWRSRTTVSAAALALSVTLACGPTVDIATGVHVEVEFSGWVPMDDGVVGQNKIVPAIAVRLRNMSDRSLGALQVNAIFHRGHDDYEWGNAFRRAAGSEGLAPGSTTDELRLWSQQGYTGIQMPAAMLANSRFVDARVDVYAKYAATPWVKVGEYAIARTLLD